MLIKLREDMRELSDPQRAQVVAGFFKTGKGHYGEGDVFCGLSVPQSRRIAAKYKDLSLDDIKLLLESEIHEERLIALVILVHNFSKGNESQKKEIYDFYLSHTKHINNWDLVDLSADKIVGEYLYSSSPPAGGLRSKEILSKLAHSENLWEKRIAMIATFAFIKHGESDYTFMIADILIADPHDLIQKAVGWMLREVGKRISLEKEEEFLKPRYKTMPRTMLRYAIERFSEEKRKEYLVRDLLK